MADNIIQVAFGDTRVKRVFPRFKIDYGLQIEFTGLTLPDTFEAHFCNDGDLTAKRQLGSNNIVTVPDEYLQTGKDVVCYIYLHPTEDSGLTKYVVRIPVKERPEVDPEEPTPEQQDVIETAIAALETGVTRAEEAAERAERVAKVTNYTDDGEGNITITLSDE